MLAPPRSSLANKGPKCELGYVLEFKRVMGEVSLQIDEAGTDAQELVQQ